jgi:serine protease
MSKSTPRLIRFSLLITLLAGLSVGTVAPSAVAQAGPSAASTAIASQIILKYKSNQEGAAQASVAAPQQLQALSAAAGAQLSYVREMSGGAHVLKLPQQLPEPEVAAIAQRLSALPEVEYAEPDRILYALGVPNDPQYGNQWHYFNPAPNEYGANLPDAWDITTGSGSVRVAVLDTGMLFDHPDLVGRTLPGYDMISNIFMARDGNGRDADASDPGDWTATNDCASGSQARNSSWHGSHVAGTIGAASDNGVGGAGINWVSQIQAVRVLGWCGGNTSDIADGIRWAAGLSVPGAPTNPTPARVLNLSLGGPAACSATMQNAVNAAVGAGAVVVVSAGNNNADASNYEPASCANVITVAATTRLGSKASYSNFGTVGNPSVEISAPGGSGGTGSIDAVLSTLNAGLTIPGAASYQYYNGTSMAAPHVSGVASLLLSISPSLTPAQVLQIMQDTATVFPTGTGSDCTVSLCGSGIVNAFESLNVLPYIADLNPDSVVLNSGALTLTVTGANFDTDAVVKWNGADRPTVVIDSTELQASISAGDVAVPGPALVSVSTSNTYGALTTASRVLNVIGQQVYLPLVTRNNVGPATSLISNGNFESGRTVWAESSTGSFALISAPPQGITAYSGSWISWLGGANNETASIQQAVLIPTNTPYLTFRSWIDSGDSAGFDYGYVRVNGVTVGTFGLFFGNETNGWARHSLDLSSYAGQTVTLQFAATTDSALLSSWFIDEVSFASTP